MAQNGKKLKTEFFEEIGIDQNMIEESVKIKPIQKPEIAIKPIIEPKKGLFSKKNQ